MPVMVPVVEAKFTLLSELSRGRRFLGTGQYRPHIVYRTAITAGGNP